MKTLAFFPFVFLLLFHFSSVGQTLQVGMRLEYIETPIGFMPPLINQKIISLEITGDTMIQGKSYFQLQSDLVPCDFNDPTLIRVEGHRIYHYMNEQDNLLYDYSLNPGDTLWQTFMNWDPDTTGDFVLMTYPVYIVDTSSVWIGDEWRKLQSIISYPDDGVYNDIGSPIEGLGSMYYFFPRFGFCESAFCLRAIYWPNGDTTMVDSLTNCFLISDTKEDDVSQTLAVVPNPVQDILYLQAEPLLPAAKIGVYDLYGRLVFKGLFSDMEKGISTQTWPQGIYFLEVRHKEKTGVVRFVKILSD